MSRLSQTCDTHNHIITRIRFLLSNRHQALPSFLPLGRPGGLVGIGVGGRKAWIQKVILNKNKWPQLVRCLVKRDSGCRIFLWPEKAGTQTNKQTHYHTWAALLNSPSTVGIKAESEGFSLSFFLIAASERRGGGGHKALVLLIYLSEGAETLVPGFFRRHSSRRMFFFKKIETDLNNPFYLQAQKVQKTHSLLSEQLPIITSPLNFISILSKLNRKTGSQGSCHVPTEWGCQAERLAVQS